MRAQVRNFQKRMYIYLYAILFLAMLLGMSILLERV
jgi:hypothetical protein